MAVSNATVTGVTSVEGSWLNLSVANVSTTNGVAAQSTFTTSAILQFTTNMTSFCPVGATINSMTMYIVARVSAVNDGGGAPDVTLKITSGTPINITPYTSTSFVTYPVTISPSYFSTIRDNGFLLAFQDFDYSAGTPTTHYLDNVYITVDYVPVVVPTVKTLFFGENF